MADEIVQKLGFDVSDAISALDRFNAAMASTRNQLAAFAQACANFKTPSLGTVGQGSQNIEAQTKALTEQAKAHSKVAEAQKGALAYSKQQNEVTSTINQQTEAIKKQGDAITQAAAKSSQTSKKRRNELIADYAGLSPEAQKIAQIIGKTLDSPAGDASMR